MRIFVLMADSPVVGEACPYCENQFAVGDAITLHALPPDDPENRAKMEAGRAYTSPALLIHVACEQTLENEQLTDA